jgi:hypothetical protein
VDGERPGPQGLRGRAIAASKEPEHPQVAYGWWVSFLNWVSDNAVWMAKMVAVGEVVIGIALILVLAWRNAGWYGLDRFLLPKAGHPLAPRRAVHRHQGHDQDHLTTRRRRAPRRVPRGPSRVRSQGRTALPSADPRLSLPGLGGSNLAAGR